MEFLPPGEHLCWCLTSTDSFLSPNRTVKCWKASDHCCHIQKLPKTNFLFFIAGFDNKSKKKGESYIEKYWSEYRIIIYFYRIFVVFLDVSSLSFTGWCGKNISKIPLTSKAVSYFLNLLCRTWNSSSKSLFPCHYMGQNLPRPPGL